MKKIFFILLLAAVIGLTSLHSAGAIGILSDPLIIESALRGETVQDTISIFNTEKEAIIFELTAEGDIADWVAYYLPEDINNPVNQIVAESKSYAKAIVEINVPEDTANGEYAGKLTATVKADDTVQTTGSSAAVSQKLSRPVTIIVTDQERLVLNATIIPETVNLSADESLSLRVIYNNQGNIKIAPKIDFKIYTLNGNKDKLVYNAIYPYPEGEPLIKSGENREISKYTIPTVGLKDGYYIAEMEFLHKDKVITSKEFKFNIGNPSAVAGAFSVSYKILWPVVGAVAVVVFLAVLFMVMKKVRVEPDKSKR